MDTKTLERYEKKMLRIGAKYRIPFRSVRNGDLNGAYYKRYLDVIEYGLHEIAHFLVCVGQLRDLPKDLPRWVEKTSELQTKQSADSLEIDAGIVVYLAGKHLGFWSDIERIRSSTIKNTRSIFGCLDDEFDKQYKKRTEDIRIWNLMVKLVNWFAFPEHKISEGEHMVIVSKVKGIV